MAKRVLIIDDDVVVARMLERVAETAGCVTWIALTPDEVASTYAWHMPDVVLLGLERDDHGAEHLRVLRDARFRNDLFLIGGDDDRAVQRAAQTARQYGLRVAGTLTKPIRLADIAELVGRINVDPNAMTSERIIDAAMRGEFLLEFQPVFTSAGRLDRLESLLRWNHPKQGRLLPQRFLPLAERSHDSIAVLTAWVIDASLIAHARLRADGVAVPFAINISALNLAEASFVDDLFKRLYASRISPDALRLEITESELPNVGPTAKAVLARLRKLGISLGLDGFGTGETTMQQLVSFSFTSVTVDRAIIARAPTSKQATGIAKSCASIATTMGYSLGASGIENERQRTFAREIGATQLQGFGIARPMSIESVRAWLMPALT